MVRNNIDYIQNTVALPSRPQAWDLDAMGAWQSLSTNGAGQSRTHNAKNQVTGVGSATLAYCSYGSMTTDHLYDSTGRQVLEERRGGTASGDLRRQFLSRDGLRIAAKCVE
jgi:hypothetical protein